MTNATNTLYQVYIAKAETELAFYGPVIVAECLTMLDVVRQYALRGMTQLGSNQMVCELDASSECVAELLNGFIAELNTLA
jgi:hypothetical protein